MLRNLSGATWPGTGFALAWSCASARTDHLLAAGGSQACWGGLLCACERGGHAPSVGRPREGFKYTEHLLGPRDLPPLTLTTGYKVSLLNSIL